MQKTVSWLHPVHNQARHYFEDTEREACSEQVVGGVSALSVGALVVCLALMSREDQPSSLLGLIGLKAVGGGYGGYGVRMPALAYRLDTNPWDSDPREMQWGNTLGYGFEPVHPLPLPALFSIRSLPFLFPSPCPLCCRVAGEGAERSVDGWLATVLAPGLHSDALR